MNRNLCVVGLVCLRGKNKSYKGVIVSKYRFEGGKRDGGSNKVD
jgi:hypothetical protein